MSAMATSNANSVRPPLRRLLIPLAVAGSTVAAASDVAAHAAAAPPDPTAACEHAKVSGDSLVDLGAVLALAPFDPAQVSQPVVVSGPPLPDLTPEIADGNVADPALCTAVPVISGYDFDGQPVSIDPAANGPTLIVASAHWCTHCDTEIDALLSWERSGELPPALDIVAVSTSLEPDGPNFPPDEWLDSRGWHWPVLADSSDEEVLVALGITSFPNLVLVDEHGLVRWRASGVSDADTIDAAVDEVLGA